MRRCCLLLLLSAPLLAADPWHTLVLGGADVWRLRVPLTLTNRSAGNVAGQPTNVRIGRYAGHLDLAGRRAQDVRVCDAAGTEMLFDLRTDAGRLSTGPIPDGATLVVPCTAPAGATQRLWVYADNPDAFAVPDYLTAGASFANGGFEALADGQPAGWRLDEGDPQHRLALVTDVARGGQRSVRATVAPGAAATWMAARQTDLGVSAGARYRVTGWVKGDNVVGRAGWYVHVAAGDNPQAVNMVAGDLRGTFDWQQVTITFTAPPQARSLNLGTVLYGTGTAWFDDAQVEVLDAAQPEVTCAVGAPERRELAEIKATGGYEADGRRWEGWAPVVVTNPGPAVSDALVSATTSPVLVKLRRGLNPRSLRLVSPLTGKALPLLRLRDQVVFLSDVPARARLTFALWYSRDPEIGDGPALSATELALGAGNLAPNPSFETGGAQPDGWAGGTEGEAQAGVSVTRVGGGKLGEWCGRTLVPAAAPARWVGWRRAVAIAPSTDYYFAAWTKTAQVDGTGARLWVHHLDAAGKWAGERGWASSTTLHGDNDWTLLGGLVRTPADTAQLEMHLTFNGHGTIWHDGVVLRRAVGSVVGEVQAAPEPGAPALRVWAEDPVVKVFRDTLPASLTGPVQLAACRSERETLQLCLRAGQDLRDVRVSVTVDGLPAPRIERVGYVPIFQPSGYFTVKAEAWERLIPTGQGRTDGWPGWWPDYLAPLPGGLDLVAGQTQPVWVTFEIPADARPGVHAATVTIDTGGRQVALPVQLRVWSHVLPRRPSLQSIYDVRTGTDLDRWLAFLAERRVGINHLQPEPRFTLRDGKVTMDAAEWDKAAELAFDRHQMSVAYFPQVFYVTGWAHPPRDFQGTKYPSAEYKAAYQQAVKLFWDHVKAKGWSRWLSLYISDEPHFTRPEVVAWLGAVIGYIREVAPDIPVYSSTWGHCPAWDGVLNHWGVGQYGVFPLDKLGARQAAGDKIWFTTDGQMETDTPYNACERLLPYYCFAHKVSGYEFWGINWYTYDPYRYGWHRSIRQADEPGKYYNVRYPHGDGYLTYPGAPLGVAGPISTIRLEQAREGLEDYEIYHALAALAQARPAVRERIAAALAEVRALAPIPNAGGYRSTDILPDPDAVARVRLRCGALLEELAGGGG